MHQLENILGNFSENVSATLTLAPNSKVYLLYERLVLLYSSMEGKYLQHFSFRLELLKESGSRIYNNIPRHKWRAHFKNLQILFQLSRSTIEKILINPENIWYTKHDRPSLKWGWTLDADLRSSHEKKTSMHFLSSTYKCTFLVSLTLITPSIF